MNDIILEPYTELELVDDFSVHALTVTGVLLISVQTYTVNGVQYDTAQELIDAHAGL